MNEALGAALPAAVAKMRLYLATASTHTILFKPVKSNIAEAHAQVGSEFMDGRQSSWLQLHQWAG